MTNAMDKRLTDKIVRYFATQPIVKAWVFGSYARGEAHSGSDIDSTLLSFAERTANNDKILIYERAS